MTKGKKGAVLAAAVAALLASGCMTTGNSGTSCKHMAKAKAHNSCKGMNSCKGSKMGDK